MKSKYKIVALFGKSGAGKDTIQKWIVSNIPNVKGIVSHTTRPPRDYETDGVDYHFVSNEEFTTKVMNGDMLEATSFRDWFYGTAIQSLDIDKVNIGVFNIDGINCLLEDPRLIVRPIHIYATDKERLLRSLNREQDPDCTEICRRFLADKADFEKVDFLHGYYYNKDGAEIDKEYWETYTDIDLDEEE